jgi:hypothetical protein
MSSSKLRSWPPGEAAGVEEFISDLRHRDHLREPAPPTSTASSRWATPSVFMSNLEGAFIQPAAARGTLRTRPTSPGAARPVTPDTRRRLAARVGRRRLRRGPQDVRRDIQVPLAPSVSRRLIPFAATVLRFAFPGSSHVLTNGAFYSCLR